MENRKFARASAARKTQAIILTVVFHVLLFGAIGGIKSDTVKGMLPANVKEMLGIEKEDVAAKAVVAKSEKERP